MPRLLSTLYSSPTDARGLHSASSCSAVPPPQPEEISVPHPPRRSIQGVPQGSGLKSPGAREATRPGGHWGYRQGTFIADPTKPARTITASTAKDWVRLPDGSLRRLTWRECAGLQGFPDDWHFAGGLASRLRQIGNAVPVPLATALGDSLLHALSMPRPRVRPCSAPLPTTLTKAMEYTLREQARNGPSRAAARTFQASQQSLTSSLKGLGSLGGRVRRGHHATDALPLLS